MRAQMSQRMLVSEQAGAHEVLADKTSHALVRASVQSGAKVSRARASGDTATPVSSSTSRASSYTPRRSAGESPSTSTSASPEDCRTCPSDCDCSGLSPLVDCVRLRDDGSLEAWFGYRATSDGAITYGPANFFSPGTYARGQPERFAARKSLGHGGAEAASCASRAASPVTAPSAYHRMRSFGCRTIAVVSDVLALAGLTTTRIKRSPPPVLAAYAASGPAGAPLESVLRGAIVR